MNVVAEPDRLGNLAIAMSDASRAAASRVLSVTWELSAVAMGASPEEVRPRGSRYDGHSKS